MAHGIEFGSMEDTRGARRPDVLEAAAVTVIEFADVPKALRDRRRPQGQDRRTINGAVSMVCRPAQLSRN
jgi:hypothetical protein